MNKAWLLFVPFCFVLFSCSLGRIPGGQTDGTLILVLSGTGMNGKTLVPSLDMNVSSFNVSGSGPGTATFSLTGVTGPSVEQSALSAGTWTINVYAFNASRDLVGSGSTSATIEAGQTSTASVTVIPLSGTGAMTVSISWATGLVSTPSVVATLTPVGDEAQNLTFSVGATSVSYSSGKTLNAGYYSLSLQLMDGGVEVWGFFEAVRILKDQTTSASFTLTSLDLLTGG